MIENEIFVKIDQFDGPLALLLHLVQKEEMSIEDLNLTKITAQYLDYINKMQELNFDIAGEYLFMASTLLHLKSQTCVTDHEQKKVNSADEELAINTRAQLIARLEELERFQKLGLRLWDDLPRRDEHIFVKPKVDKKLLANSILAPMDQASILQVMMDLIRREHRKYTVVKRDRLSIKEKLRFLRDNLKQGEQWEFSKLVDYSKGVDEIVITFISLLELARLGRLALFQNEDTKEIYVEVMQSLDNFDVDQADGFESETPTPAAQIQAVPVTPENETLH